MVDTNDKLTATQNQELSFNRVWRHLPERKSTMVAACFIATLLFSGLLWIWSDRSLYGDSSYLLLTILQTKTFFHVSATRTFSTFMTQLPVVLALKLGVRSMPAFIGLYTLGMALVPVACHAASLWISRRDPILFSASVFVVLVCFYPTSFLLVGEGNVYLGLFWLSFILLITGRVDSPYYAALLLALSCAAMRTYEISAFFSLVLAALCGFRLIHAPGRASRLFLALAIILFLSGAWSGFDGAFFPRDANNEHSFALAILYFWQNGTLEGIMILTLMGIASAFAQDRWLALVMILLTSGGLALFVYWQLDKPAYLSLGYAEYQRAQAFVILGALVAVLISRLPEASQLFEVRFNPFALVLPLAAIAFLDAYDSVGMHTYLEDLCTVLEFNSPILREQFFETAAAQKFGWGWTFPIVSALVRPAGDQNVLVDPASRGWAPYDPRQPLPEIEPFKRNGSFCRSQTMPPYTPGTTFRANRPAPPNMLMSGWESTQAPAIWTVGTEARIDLRPILPGQGDLRLELVLGGNGALLTAAHPVQHVVVTIDGRPIGTLIFVYNEPNRLRVLAIPRRLVQSGRVVEIGFRLPDAVAPRDLGINGDGRLLGIYVSAIRLVYNQ